VDAGEDITLCSSEVEAQLSGAVSGPSSTGIWTTNGSGSFVPNATDLNASYQWSSEDVENQVVEIYLTSTDIGNCLAVTDTLILNIFPQGTADAGPDVIACANNPEVQLEGVLTGADIGLWTTSGSGSFAPSPNELSTTYVPSEADIASGSVQLVLNAVNRCNLASDFMEVSFVPAPIPDAGPDQAVCGDVIPFQINGSITNAGGGVWSTSGSGTFQNASNLSTFYVASQADIDAGGVFLILTSTDNGSCFSESDSLFIDISTGILVDAGEDREACIEAGSIQLFGEISNGSTTGTWTTSGDGSFTPTANDPNATYLFTQNDIDNGSVTLTLTSTNNGICEEASDSFELTFGDAAFVFAGDDIEVCETTSSVQLDGVVSGETNTGIWTTSGDGTFIPDATTLDAVYEPGTGDYAAASVEITLTSTNSVLCSEGSSSLTISFQPLPVANAGNDLVVCGSIQALQLIGQVTNATGGFWQTSGSGTFLPDPNTLTATYTPSVADSIIGDITLTLTTTGNADCEAATDELMISFSGAVVVNAGPNQEVCEDAASVDLEGTVTGSDSFEWSTSGAGSFDPGTTGLITSYIPAPDDIDEGSIQIYLSAVWNENCPSTLDSLTLSFDRIPVIDAPGAISVCVTEPSVVVSTDVDFADGVIWSTTGSGVFLPDNESEDITYEPSAADIAAGDITLTIQAISEGECGVNEQFVQVNFRELAQVNAGLDQVACESDGQVSLSGSVDGEDYQPVWTTTSFGTFDPDNTSENTNYIFGNNDILIGEATLILSSTNNGACPAISDTVTITINTQPVVDAGDDDFICRSTGLVPLNGSVSNAESFEWSTLGDGAFLPSEDVLDPEYVVGNLDVINEQVELILTAEGLEGCSSTTDTVTITINNPVIADFSFSPSCVGAATQFTDQSKVLAGSIAAWRWNFGAGNISNQQNPVFAFTSVGTPSVELVVTSSLGCNDTITQFVNVVEGPTAAFLVSDNPAPINFEVDFQDASSDAVDWFWDFGDDFGTANTQNASYSFDEEGDYIVTLLVTGATGCVDSAQTNLVISGELILPPRLPNSFSPNGDGMNDVFFVRGGPFIELDFRVYDSWGAEIFATTDQEIGWDGFINGNQAPTGVYVYTINAVNLEGESFEGTGKINLFR
jgi:gliding motility-associated-like protein